MHQYQEGILKMNIMNGESSQNLSIVITHYASINNKEENKMKICSNFEEVIKKLK